MPCSSSKTQCLSCLDSLLRNTSKLSYLDPFKHALCACATLNLELGSVWRAVCNKIPHSDKQYARAHAHVLEYASIVCTCSWLALVFRLLVPTLATYMSMMSGSDSESEVGIREEPTEYVSDWQKLFQLVSTFLI